MAFTERIQSAREELQKHVQAREQISRQIERLIGRIQLLEELEAEDDEMLLDDPVEDSDVGE